MAAQNSTANSTKKVPGRPFVKGESGNPGGRPKGMGEEIRRRYGDDGSKLVELYEAIAFANAEWLAAHDFEVPTNDERMKAGEWLSNRGYGKPPTDVNLTAKVDSVTKVVHEHVIAKP